KRPMTKVKRAVEKGESQGFMKIVVDAGSGEILGAAILGPGGDEVVHSILDVMYAKAPWTTIRRAVHIHPTVSELIPTMLWDLKPLDAWRRSARRATVGATRTARRAGMRLAARTATSVIARTPANAIGSVAVTPKSMPSSRRVKVSAAATPTPMPASASTN